MIDREQRHRRLVLAWVLILLAVLLLALVAFVWLTLSSLRLRTMGFHYALGMGLTVVFLALGATGVYLLHTVRGR